MTTGAASGFCTECGLSTVRRSESLFVCAAGHANWVNPAAGATVFIVDDNKVLYGIRSRDPGSGRLDAPGGFIEVNETAEHAAVREAKEELGVDVELVAFLGTYTSMYEGRPILNLAYVGRIVGGHLAPGDDMGGGQPVWRRIDDLPRRDEQAAEWFTHAHDDLREWLLRQQST